jgi:hypothetical protein
VLKCSSAQVYTKPCGDSRKWRRPQVTLARIFKLLKRSCNSNLLPPSGSKLWPKPQAQVLTCLTHPARMNRHHAITISARCTGSWTLDPCWRPTVARQRSQAVILAPSTAFTSTDNNLSIYISAWISSQPEPRCLRYH